MKTRSQTRGQAVTRADVARLAGVSDAVVSYVLNDGPKPVAKATRQRVLEAVEALGYRPNASARALSRGVTDMVGMVVPDARNPYFGELTQAVANAARRHGRSLLVANSADDGASTSEHIRGLWSHELDGLVIADDLSAAERTLVAAMGVPLVFINQFSRDLGTAAYGVDYQEGARTGVEHLIGHGHTRIAFVGGDHALDHRELGWLDALEAAGLPIGPRYRGGFSLEAGYQAGLLILAERARPSAVFVASDHLALAVICALTTHGLRVPEDVAIVSFDGTAESAYTSPPLTTVKQPIQDLANSAVSRLILGADVSPVSRFDTELVRRSSCGCGTLG